MSFVSKQFIRAAIVGALIPLFSATASVSAQAPDHVVSSTQMQQATADASQGRQQNIDSLNHFFSSDAAQQALRDAKIDPQQVKSAIPTLSDQDLAQLSARANSAQQKFAAGNMSDHDLLLILVVVAVVILLIVAVH